MPLSKILFKPGINRENTRYTTEGGWYDGDKVRFRQGTPEKIGGWQRISPNTFLGVCRSLWNWTTLANLNLVGVGTNLKFYIEKGGAYNDITPIRTTVTLTNPFTATLGSAVITVADTAHGCSNGDFVTFSGATGLGGNITAALLNKEHQITLVNANVYTITVGAVANATDVSGSPGGGTVTAAYQINTGPTFAIPLTGWGAGPWGSGTWGTGGTSTSALRLWSQQNYGEDLVFGPRGGGIYYWNATGGVTSRGVLLNSLGGPVEVSLTTPTVITGSTLFTSGAALQFQGNLPPSMQPDTTYYVFDPDGLSYRLLDANGDFVGASLPPNVLGVTGLGGVGTVVASVTPLLTLSGVSANGGTGTVAAVSAQTGVYLSGVSAEGAVGATNLLGVALSGVSASGTTGVFASADHSGVALSGVTSVGNTGTVLITGSLSGAYVSKIVDVPAVQNRILVSDTFRFIITFGANDYGSTEQDPMLIRWSNQDDPYNWTPDATNQAGSIRLSDGSEIVTAIQTRQEIVVFTNSAVYSLQYLGPPNVWQTQLLGSNISIEGPNAVALASGVVYWMGVDKFYAYDGRVQTLNCDVRRYVFSDFNQAQSAQVFAGTNEGFNEVWWFYCSQYEEDGVTLNNTVNRYVVYNYLEKIWYYGNLGRTAWLDSGIRDFPMAATYTNNIVYHESGINDNETGTTLPIAANISSSEFDIQDGHQFGFVWRVLPDLTFENSSNSPTMQAPAVTMTLYGLSNSGSGVTSSAGAPVAKGSTYVITEEFAGQIYTRMRGRQLIFKIESNQINTAWQIGAPRIDIRPDGRR
jgi:hypothetical protein